MKTGLKTTRHFSTRKCAQFRDPIHFEPYCTTSRTGQIFSGRPGQAVAPNLKGSRQSTPVRAISLTLRVAKVRPCEWAVAAINASITGKVPAALNRPHV